MALGEEGCWVPPLRKYTGVPSLATFRRTALTPWNSVESSASDSPPQSPLHPISQESTKRNQDKESIDNTRLSPLCIHSNKASPKTTASKDDEDGKRIDRLFKTNENHNSYRRRVKSSEPLGRERYPNSNLATRTDGRDSIRLKNKDNNKGRFRRSNIKENTKNFKNNVDANCKIRIEQEFIKGNLENIEGANNTHLHHGELDSITYPVIEVTESSIEFSKNNNKIGKRAEIESIGKVKDFYPKKEIGKNLYVNRTSSVNGYRRGRLRRSGSVSNYRSLSPSNPIERERSNSCRSSRIPSRMGVNIKNSILDVRVIDTVEKSHEDTLIPIGFEENVTKYDESNSKEKDDEKDTNSSSETEDEAMKDEAVDHEDSTSEDKADHDSSDDKSDIDQDDDSDIKDDTPVEDGEMKARRRKKKADTLEVPSPKVQASPQQLLRIHGVTLTKEKLKKLRSIVDKAAQRKKVFTIFGKYPSIREALVSRGWVQNFDLQKLTLPHTRQNDNEVSVYAKLRLGTGVGEEELALISRMLRDTPVHFVWIMGDTVDWKSLSKSTIVSRFPRVYFTTKVGLCSYLEESHWFCEASVSHVNFPRCYTTDDLGSFIRDFRLTACMGLIRTLIAAIDNNQANIFDGKIPLSAIKFAVKRCSEFVSVEEHEDIDMDSEERVWDHQWDQFLTYYYQLVHENETFVPANEEQTKALYACCKAAIEGVKPYWPQLELDGVTNLWLVKPGAKSRGRGISVCNKLERIMTKIGSSNQPSTDMNPPACSSRFVIQKYVERPLLIHNTKFDIRQWFLVTSAYPLTIWMYKESYLRFCSQLFSLSNLHESVHLTNNAVQCRYRNQTKRDKALPDENMWDSYTFQAYLRTLGRRDEWESIVYPGMRESITGALLAAQDHMEPRPNCFELYGADFILTEDLKPWLIEINSSPAMSATTSVTARMCPQCLEDVIKVVIDRRSNRDAPTGQFELIYRQNVSTPQPYMGMNLTVRGSPAPRGKMPPPTWVSADGIQPPSHHVNIQNALDSLADHLVTIT